MGGLTVLCIRDPLLYRSFLLGNPLLERNLPNFLEGTGQAARFCRSWGRVKDVKAQLTLSPGNKALVFCRIGKDLHLTILLLYTRKIFFPTRKSSCSLFHHVQPLGNLSHRDQKKLRFVPRSLNQKLQYS